MSLVPELEQNVPSLEFVFCLVQIIFRKEFLFYKMEDEAKVVEKCEEIRVQEDSEEEYQDPFEDLPPIFTNSKDGNRKLKLQRINHTNAHPPPASSLQYFNINYFLCLLGT